VLQVAQYTATITRALTVSLLCLFAACVSPRGDVEDNDKAELAERHAFIRKAMQQQEEEDSEHIRQLARVVTGKDLDLVIVGRAISISQLRPFADWDVYVVVGGMIHWRPNQGSSMQEVIVPSGFVSDLASIPRIFWQILRPTGRYAYAAVVHDYLYWTQVRSRDEADQIFRIAMEDSKVDSRIMRTLYQAVRQFGQSAWDNNARLRKAGECRFLRRLPEDFTISWTEWKKQADVFASDCNL